MQGEDQPSIYEKLSRCRTRLAGVRMSSHLGFGPLRDAVDHCWSDLADMIERGVSDGELVDAMCRRVDRLVDALALL